MDVLEIGRNRSCQKMALCWKACSTLNTVTGPILKSKCFARNGWAFVGYDPFIETHSESKKQCLPSVVDRA